jgi:hypothetical protein
MISAEVGILDGIAAEHPDLAGEVERLRRYKL